MKPKHTSLIAIVLVGVIIGLALWYEFHHPRGLGERQRLASLKPLSELHVPDKPTLAQMDRLERKMHLLAAPPPQIKRLVDLSSLGYVPLTGAPSTDSKGRPIGSMDGVYRVTLAFDGKIKRYCAIDGRLYAEGEALPDGAVIEKIESRRVRIAKENIQQWLVVAPFFDTALSEKRLQGDNG